MELTFSTTTGSRSLNLLKVKVTQGLSCDFSEISTKMFLENASRVLLLLLSKNAIRNCFCIYQNIVNSKPASSRSTKHWRINRNTSNGKNSIDFFLITSLPAISKNLCFSIFTIGRFKNIIFRKFFLPPH